jgi:energy-coupling factor transport system ATP-binding protein
VSTLTFECFGYRYPGAGEPALTDVTLHVEAGEFLVLAGLSASGKSTLVRAACGLVPHFHGGEASGRVLVGGLDTRSHGPGELAAVCGTLLQEPETQIVMGTVRAEIAFPLENLGLGAAAVARGVEEAALALGIGDLLDRTTHELSGGELQRVALAAALSTRPALVLLDEPTSQLDPVAGDELVWLLRRLNEEWGTAVVLAEHRLERCLAHADRVAVVQDGRLACDAPPQQMLDWAAEHSPALLTPSARLFARAGLRPLPSGVKEARATLRMHGLLDDGGDAPPADGRRGEAGAAGGSPPDRGPAVAESGVPTADAAAAGVAAAGVGTAAVAAATADAPGRLARALGRRRGAPRAEPALAAGRLWHELPGGRAILRGVNLAFAAGETVALMGRNGAGKSTLLRHLAGLEQPTRGRVTAGGRVALLLQNPGDYLIHERVSDEAGAAALERVGLGAAGERDPRDLSGGERQRLALAIVLDGGEPPVAVLLDEPTRGMDRAAKGELADRLRAMAQTGTVVLVATHDAEFAAAVAQRVVLLADGRPIADAPVADVLSGGWHFATETARVLGGAGGALTPEQGGALVRGRMSVEVTP